MPGVVVLGQMVQGHDGAEMLTVTPAAGVSRLPLSSTARLRSVIEPVPVTVHA